MNILSRSTISIFLGIALLATWSVSWAESIKDDDSKSKNTLGHRSAVVFRMQRFTRALPMVVGPGGLSVGGKKFKNTLRATGKQSCNKVLASLEPTSRDEAKLTTETYFDYLAEDAYDADVFRKQLSSMKATIEGLCRSQRWEQTANKIESLSKIKFERKGSIIRDCHLQGCVEMGSGSYLSKVSMDARIAQAVKVLKTAIPKKNP